MIYKTNLGVIEAVSGASLYIDSGEFLGLVGESGSGKSTLAYSFLRKIPHPGKIVEGKIFLRCKDIMALPEEKMRRIRWKEVSIIPQAAMNALNPVYRIGDQIAEVITEHEGISKREALSIAENLLDLVGIGRQRSSRYPHQLSGGQRQRVAIAMALALNPPFIIADEPTTALDAIAQVRILNLFKELRNRRNLSLLFISHDISTVLELADRIAVMYAGKILEVGPADKVFSDPLHPYTKALIRAIPQVGGERRKFHYIPGSPPGPMVPSGCVFHPRCTEAFEPCDKEEPELIEVRDLKKYFTIRENLFDILKRRYTLIKAVNGLNFSIRENEVFCLTGESGCGKSTTGRLLVRLLKPTSGQVIFEGKNIYDIPSREFRRYRRKMQIIFQDPYESLNPRMSIYELLEEPLRIHNIGDEKERFDLIYRSLEDVGLDPPEDFMVRYPHQLSGGQRQRVAIARAMILNPKFLVADEPVSMLDVSIRAGILKLMIELKEKRNLTYLFITHDLSVAYHICDRIAVMYLGKIMEIGPADMVILDPLHPYTRALVEAIPKGRTMYRKLKDIPIKGDVSGPMVPSGCVFHPRCTEAFEPCDKEEPELIEVEKGRFVACHLYNHFNERE